MFTQDSLESGLELKSPQFFLKSRETELTLAYISTVHSPSNVRGFSLFLRGAEGCEEEVVHSHLPSRLSCQFKISDSSRCLYRVGDKL